MGTHLDKCIAVKDVRKIVDRMERYLIGKHYYFTNYTLYSEGRTVSVRYIKHSG